MSSFSITTFNVLHDNSLIVKKILQGKKRFKAIAQQMLSSESDIYCTNQTTPAFLQLTLPLLTQKYPHQSPYIKSHRGHCVMIFSKYPLVHLQNLESTAIARADLPDNQSVIVVSSHLRAEETQAARRQQELKVIQDSLKKIFENGDEKTRVVFQKRNVILLGDLNLHKRNETGVLYGNGYYDCWVERKGEEEGYTWDPLRNKLINYILPYDNRRMRLDRIAVKNGAHLKVNDIRIIHDTILDDTRYLFKSDHFGLVANFTFSPSPVLVDHSTHLQKISNLDITGFRTINYINFLRLSSIGGFAFLATLLTCLSR